MAQATALWLAGHSKREACRQTGVITAVRRLRTVPDPADVGLARIAERLASLSQGSVTWQVEPPRVIEAEAGKKG